MRVANFLNADVPWATAHIYYNLDMIQHEDPVTVSEQTIVVDNSHGGTSYQTRTLTYSKASSTGSHDDANAHTWANKVGGEVGGDEYSGIPFVDKTEIKMKGIYHPTDTRARKWGTSVSTIEIISMNNTGTAGPGEMMKGEAIITTQKFAISYKLWKYTKSPKLQESVTDEVGPHQFQFCISIGFNPNLRRSKFFFLNIRTKHPAMTSKE